MSNQDRSNKLIAPAEAVLPVQHNIPAEGYKFPFGAKGLYNATGANITITFRNAGEDSTDPERTITIPPLFPFPFVPYMLVETDGTNNVNDYDAGDLLFFGSNTILED